MTPMQPRLFLRRHVPYPVRLQFRLFRRRASDLRSRPRFARAKGEPAAFLHTWAAYDRPWVDYAGQAEWSAGKRHNLGIMAEAISGSVIQPGEVFSLGRAMGRPSRRRGYQVGAALKCGELTSDIGGGVCLFSTLIYNLALLSGMEIVERHAHSQDSYGANRYFELGRDAAIEYGYLDLRFRNPHAVPLMMTVAVEPSRVSGAILGPKPCPFDVEIRAAKPEILPAPTLVLSDPSLLPGEERVSRPGLPGLVVRATRTFNYADGQSRTEDLPLTTHHPVANVVHRGPPVRTE